MIFQIYCASILLSQVSVYKQKMFSQHSHLPTPQCTLESSWTLFSLPIATSNTGTTGKAHAQGHLHIPTVPNGLTQLSAMQNLAMQLIILIAASASPPRSTLCWRCKTNESKSIHQEEGRKENKENRP